MQHSPTAAAKKLSVSLVLSWQPQQSSAEPIDYKMSRLMLHHEHKLRVNKTKKQAAIGRSNTAFEWKYVMSVFLCFTR